MFENQVIGQDGWQSRNVPSPVGLGVKRIQILQFGGPVVGSMNRIRVEHSAECIAIGNNSIMNACYITENGGDRRLLVDQLHPLMGHVQGPFLIESAVAGVADTLELYIYESAPPPSIATGRALHRRAWRGGTLQTPDWSYQGIGQIFTAGRRRWSVGYSNGSAAGKTLTFLAKKFDILTGNDVEYVFLTTASIGAGSTIVVDSESQSLACDFDVLWVQEANGFADASTLLVMTAED